MGPVREKNGKAVVGPVPASPLEEYGFPEAQRTGDMGHGGG